MRLKTYAYITKAEMLKAILAAPTETVFVVYMLANVPVLPMKLSDETGEHETFVKLTVIKQR